VPSSVSLAFHQLLNAFIFTLSGSYARTGPEVLWLLQQFATIELTLAAIAWLLYRQNWMAAMVWKLLGFAFLAWLLTEWPRVTQWLRDGFIEAGLLVGGNVLTITDITDPGNIVDFGLSVTALLIHKLGQLSLLYYGFEIIIGGMAALLIILFYAIVGVHVFKALLEYYIASACLIFLVPFLAHEKTAPFAERVFGTFLAHAMRLLVYAAILSIALPILHTYQLSMDPTFGETVMLLSASLLFFTIALSAPAMASGLIQGAPVLSFSNLMFGTQSALQTFAAVGAAGAAVSVAGAVGLRGAVTGASAYYHAAQLGAAQYAETHRGGSPAASAAIGAAQGVGQYTAHAMTSGFRAAVQEGRVRASRAFTANGTHP
jgi:type IV secretion system protein TrbL